MAVSDSGRKDVSYSISDGFASMGRACDGMIDSSYLAFGLGLSLLFVLVELLRWLHLVSSYLEIHLLLMRLTAFLAFLV